MTPGAGERLARATLIRLLPACDIRSVSYTDLHPVDGVLRFLVSL